MKYAFPIIVALILMGTAICRWQYYDYPDTYSIPNVKQLTQPDGITCGPTSSAMLLDLYGTTATVKELSQFAKTNWFRYDGKEIGGTCPEYVQYALAQFGLDARMCYATFDDLKYYISHNRPPIVLVRSGEAMWHFVLAVGYDKESVEIVDPGNGFRYKIMNKAFLGCWDFTTDMGGREMTGPYADFLLFLIQIGETRRNTLVVPVHSYK